ncbi:hypothetical protein A6E14_13550 [Vibrio genomosp. F10]|uniref:Alpha/beta hydrolase n=1 Tax=Vibrio genomosp. F10 TaxID=723171 RepID=A0A1B9QWK2_9VIBR|nr:hypothetical protein A6E14_13550 [Vibrio genomosp. F10]
MVFVQCGIAVSRDGEPIAYGTIGSGETALIFIHGWSLDSRLWLTRTVQHNVDESGEVSEVGRCSC